MLKNISLFDTLMVQDHTAISSAITINNLETLDN